MKKSDLATQDYADPTIDPQAYIVVHMVPGLTKTEVCVDQEMQSLVFKFPCIIIAIKGSSARNEKFF